MKIHLLKSHCRCLRAAGQGVRGRLPGVGGAGRAGLNPGQQRDCRAACKMMGLKPGEKIRILKENSSFFPCWWGKGRFTTFSCHNQAQSLGLQTEYWIFFSSRKQIQYFLILLSCRAGQLAPWRGEPSPPERLGPPRGLCHTPTLGASVWVPEQIPKWGQNVGLGLVGPGWA